MHFISLIISFCGKQLLKWHLRATRVKNKPPVDLIGGRSVLPAAHKWDGRRCTSLTYLQMQPISMLRSLCLLLTVAINSKGFSNGNLFSPLWKITHGLATYNCPLNNH